MLKPDVGTSTSFNFMFLNSRYPYFGGSKDGCLTSPISNLLNFLISNYLVSRIISLRSGLISTEPIEELDDEFSVSCCFFFFFFFFACSFKYAFFSYTGHNESTFGGNLGGDLFKT